MVYAVLISADSRMTNQVKDWFCELAHDVRLDAFASLSEFAKAFTDDSEAELLAQKEKLTTSGSAIPAGDDSAAPLPASSAATSAESSAESSAATSAASGEPSVAAAGVSSATISAVSEIKKRIRIRLLIVDADLLDQKVTIWTSEIRRALALKGFEDPDQPIRILLLAFEDPKIPVGRFRHPSINDLVLKPLERSLFLQKIEFLIADTPDVKPSFLFRQPVHASIEIGKDTWLEEISEFTLSIVNPSPLKNGMFISVHSEIFGEGAASQVYARVLGNLRHPVRKGAYLVRMSYFGISTDQLNRVRRYVRDHFREAKPKTSEIERAKRQLACHDSDRDGAVEKRIAIIEMNREIASSIESTLRSHFSGLDIRNFSSYAKFMSELIRNSDGGGQSTQMESVSLASMIPASEEEADLLSIAAESGISSVMVSEDPNKVLNSEASAVAGLSASSTKTFKTQMTAAFPQGKSLSVILDAKTHQLIRFDSSLGPGALVLGKKLMDWNQRPESWSASVLKEDREEYLEFLNYISHGAQGSTLLRMLNSHGEVVYVDLKGILEKSGKVTGEPEVESKSSNGQELSAQLRVDFREVEEAKWHFENEKSRREEDHLAFQFDLIFIDGAFIRGDLANWIIGLKTLFAKTGVSLANGSIPPIVILGEERTILTPQNFRHPEIFGFLTKPLDRRLVSEMVAQFVPDVSLRPDSETLNPHPCKIEVCTASDILMSGISEFGLSIVQNSPTASIRPNTYMRFFSPILGTSPTGVLGRCAFSQAVTANEKTITETQFHFFGVNDELFRRIRTWIVENYVNSKQGS